MSSNSVPYQPVKDAVNYYQAAGPCYDAVQHEVKAAKQYTATGWEVHEQRGFPYSPQNIHQAGYNKGYVDGVADQVKREEPATRPGPISKAWYNQTDANRRRLDVQRAVDMSKEYDKHLDRIWESQKKQEGDNPQRTMMGNSAPPAYEQNFPYSPPAYSDNKATGSNLNSWNEGRSFVPYVPYQGGFIGRERASY